MGFILKPKPAPAQQLFLKPDLARRRNLPSEEMRNCGLLVVYQLFLLKIST